MDSSPALAQVDTTTDVKAIIAKVNSFVMANKIDEGINYLKPKLTRVKGAEKAALVNELGGLYFLKDDPDNAVANYLAASDLDPDNALYLINVATTYENLDRRSNAMIFAKKVLELQTASDSDKVAAQEVIARCNRLEDGH